MSVWQIVDVGKSILDSAGGSVSLRKACSYGDMDRRHT